jgi:hypothetical protein
MRLASWLLKKSRNNIFNYISGAINTDEKIKITAEFKAWAKARVAYASIDGLIETSVTGGAKFGVYKKSLEYESPPWILMKENKVPFDKYYLI